MPCSLPMSQTCSHPHSCVIAALYPMRALRALRRTASSLPHRSLSSVPHISSSVTFPRQGADVNHALNWQLCEVSVIPQQRVARNVKASKPITAVDAASAVGKLYQVSSVSKGQTITPFGDLLASIGGSHPPTSSLSAFHLNRDICLQRRRRMSCSLLPLKACLASRSCTWRMAPSAQVPPL